MKLFMVPWLAAGILSGAASAKARSRVSTIRWEVSTFPPATAAGGCAFTIVPSGVITEIGRSKPDVAGTSSATRQLKT